MTSVQTYNEQRLKLISPSIRDHIAAVIKDMECAGWQPLIDIGVYRTPAEQLKKKQQGYSTVSYSYHNVTDKGGVPASLAADIVDARFLWSSNCPRKYWIQLAAAAENQGLQTGIYFGLSRKEKDAIHTALGKRMWDANVKLGWDTAHVQPWQWRYPLTAVRLGIRPNLSPVKRGLFYVILVVNDAVVDGAFLHEGHWYCLVDRLAKAVGGQVYTPGQTVPVVDTLRKWNLSYITNDRRATRGRFDIRTFVQEK